MNVRGIPLNVKCPYRSREWTGTGILGVFLLVWVQPMDLYEHSDVLEIELSLATLIILLACPFQGQVQLSGKDEEQNSCQDDGNGPVMLADAADQQIHAEKHSN